MSGDAVTAPFGTWESHVRAMEWQAQCRGEPPPDDAEIAAAFDAARAAERERAVVGQPVESSSGGATTPVQMEAVVVRPFIPTLLDITKPPGPARFVHDYLYAGRITTLQGEPGCGKSWLALWICAQMVGRGEPVVYLDEEGGPDLVTERLAALR